MELFKAKLGSPITQIAENITNTQTTISLVNADVLPDAPNIATIGTGVNAETIRYSGKTLNTLTGVTRGFTGTAKAWASGQSIARIFTQYDHDSVVESVGDVATLTTTDKSSIVNAINEIDATSVTIANNLTTTVAGKALDATQGKIINDSLVAHKAESASDVGGVHGLEVEEGTWTPVLAGLTVAGNHTYTTQVGNYRRNGNIVVADFYIILATVDATMSGTYLYIGGLPFSPAQPTAPSFRGIAYVDFSPGSFVVGSYFSGSPGIILTIVQSGAGGTFLQTADFQTESILSGSIVISL